MEWAPTRTDSAEVTQPEQERQSATERVAFGGGKGAGAEVPSMAREIRLFRGRGTVEEEGVEEEGGGGRGREEEEEEEEEGGETATVPMVTAFVEDEV